ncbi:plasmid recombination protein [Burkholderia seminalis]|uniref:Plasmid recombination protein n=2 Tax=Burkholderia cepacia complex TaxID=87882 RepID=A0A8A8D5Q8_9BURK|nr:plasmid recombination protein [Burkholderia seminalis]QTO19907.1 plasmid recombination protein [Burkholderia seminalis]
MSSAYVALKKLVGAGIVLTAARHNLREIAAEIGPAGHIDANRMHLNRIIDGPQTAVEVASLAEETMRAAGVRKLRKDAVRAVEALVSLSADSHVDVMSVFSDALEWLRGHFEVPVLSAVAHLDESAPHAHVLLLPLRDGRMIGSDLVGNRAQLLALQRGFAEDVAARHGLGRPKAQKRPTASMRRRGAEMALASLRGAPKRLSEPGVRTALLEAIAADPEPVLRALGLSMPELVPRRSRTFVQIMTRAVKAEPDANPTRVCDLMATETLLGDARAPPVLEGANPTSL